MVVAGRLVREGEADAMISGGNTGALMVTGLLVVGLKPQASVAPRLLTRTQSMAQYMELFAYYRRVLVAWQRRIAAFFGQEM